MYMYNYYKQSTIMLVFGADDVVKIKSKPIFKLFLYTTSNYNPVQGSKTLLLQLAFEVMTIVPTVNDVIS